jgi:hypothetical protein
MLRNCRLMIRTSLARILYSCRRKRPKEFGVRIHPRRIAWVLTGMKIFVVRSNPFFSKALLFGDNLHA